MTDIVRHRDHPIPEGNKPIAYLADGVYLSRDDYQYWISCDRENSFHAIALDVETLEALFLATQVHGR